MKLRDYQDLFVRNLRTAFKSDRRVLGVMPTGSGKCLGKGTPVMLYDGRVVPVETVRVGDLLMGPDSTPRRVMSLARGREQLWRIVPNRGDSYVVNESHILSLKMTRGAKRGTGLPDGAIIDIPLQDYLRSTRTFKHCAKGYKVPVRFPIHPFQPALDPYFLGVWLGDGHSAGPMITTGDPEIKAFCAAYAAAFDMTITETPNSANSVILRFKSAIWEAMRGRGIKSNPILNALRHYNLIGAKHIPHRFLTGSNEERRQVLAGILDTDGHWSGKGFALTLKSERLLDDVIFVARSLGFSAYKREMLKKSQNGTVGTYYGCSIDGAVETIPCRIARKKAAPRRQKKDVLVTGIRAEPIGVGDYYGFEIDGDRRFLLGDFTVTHNTACFSYIARGIQANSKRVLTCAHRRELLKQISGAMTSWGVNHAVFTADSRGTPRAPVVVASVFTLANRLKHFPEPDLIIIDEAHHAALGTTWSKVINQFPRARILGVTATPQRLDGRGLGDNFDVMVEGPSVAELTAMGWLSPAEVYAPKHALDLRGIKVRGGDYVASELTAAMDKPSITGNAVEHYARLANGKRAVVFCCSIQHAEDVAEEFRGGGFRAEHIDGGMEDYERDAALYRFATGETQVLTSCDLISEGFDLPTIEVAILLRPTKSLGLYLQQVGRAIRPMEGKARTLILDHAGNTAEHGFIDEPRTWTLDARERKKAGPSAPPVRVCPKCYAMHKPGPVCPKCGHVYEVTGREVQQVDGELERIAGPEEIAEAMAEMQWQARYKILVNVGKSRSMENPERWATKVMLGEYARRLAKEGREASGYMVDGLTLEERDKFIAMLRGTENQVEMVV